MKNKPNPFETKYKRMRKDNQSDALFGCPEKKRKKVEKRERNGNCNSDLDQHQHLMHLNLLNN